MREQVITRTGERVESAPVASLRQAEAARLDVLDCLRGIAAFAVFIRHAGILVSANFQDFSRNVIDLGDFGVILFFLCSGFIIPVSLERQNSLRKFWVRRVFRLYPLYWLSIAGMIVCALVGMAIPLEAMRSAAPVSVGSVLANMTMLQSLLGVSHVLPVYWTLSFEMLFYVIVSVLFALGWNKHSVALAVVFCLAALLVQVILPLIFGVADLWSRVNLLSVLFLGTVIYRAQSGALKPRIGFYVIALGLSILVITTVADSISTGGDWYYLPAVTARIGAFVVFGIGMRLSALQWPWVLRWLGRVSYSLYLMHPFVLAAIPAASNPAVALLAWSIALIGLSSVTYRWIEAPAITLGHRLTRSS